MADRRRLIDELVATGVPAATAEESGRPKAPLLLLAYILIPLLAILLLSGQESDEAAAGDEAPPAAAGPTTAIAAEGSKFDLEQITLVAGEATSLDFDNKDAGVQHNVAIYEDDTAESEIFKGDLVTGPETITYEFDAPEAGE